MRPSWRRAAALGTAVLLVLAGCAGGLPGPTGSPRPSATGAPRTLRGVCPDPVVVQTDWFAEAEYGLYYHLLGPGYTIDTRRKRVVGPLVAGGRDTGVRIEVRYGGAAIGYQQVSSQLYMDRSITLGQVSTDEAIQNSAKLPTLAVLAPTEVSPYMIMWDRTRHPDVHTIADLGRAGTKVLYYQTDTYMLYLLGAGILRPGQVDGGYSGAPDRWVASGGTIAQAGFATSEPYIYQYELAGGRRYQVALQLVNDTGYPNYAEALVIRTADRSALAPCLRRLVPILQRAQVEFVQRPRQATAVIIRAVQADRGDVWNYSPGLAAFAVRRMVQLGLVGNGPNGTLGDLEPDRVQRMIDILRPVLTQRHVPVRAGLRPADLATNEFVDPRIGLPG